MRMPLLLLALSAASSALAQQPGVPAPEAAAAAPQVSGQVSGPVDPGDPRINQLIIYGNDPCPQSNDEEIIVCARLSEDDRFRIPPGLRQNPNAPAIESWSNRAIELSYAGRTGIGSCSPAGAGGMIGCFNQIVQQARAERADNGGVDWQGMIEEAREERMRRINAAEAQEVEDDRGPQ